MIRSVTVTNYLGETKKFDLAAPLKSGFAIESIDGLGPPQATVNAADFAASDGAHFNSSRVGTRNIVLSLIFVGERTIEEIRHESYRYFPLKKQVTLLIQTDERVCKTTGYVESNEPDIFSQTERTQISIICPDPYLYSNTYETTEFYGTEHKFEFPFSNDSLNEHLLEFGEIRDEGKIKMRYSGDVEIGLDFTIHFLGGADEITITNMDTQEKMTIDISKAEQIKGSPITAGDDICISTRTGGKYVRLLSDGKYTNILNCVDKNSDWFTLRKGINIFKYSAKQGLMNLEITTKNQIAYEGV